MLRPGKLPLEALDSLLAGLPRRDPRVLAGPSVGRDAAVIDLGANRLLIATSDPVTFATEDIGWYAVHVNANDVACMGGQPAWFLATVLLPAGSSDDLPATILGQLARAAASIGVEIIGGHTEVTDGIDRPIIAGTMLGECSRDALIDGSGIAPGDAIVLCGQVAIEGTAILAREAVPALGAAGMDGVEIAAASGLLHDPGISILSAAKAITAVTRPRLMHDPTEGGIATALHELAAVADARLRVDSRRIPVHEATRRVCGALQLDPLGLLASGALLAVLPADSARAVEAGAVRGGAIIGWIESGPRGVILEPDGISFPSFDRDEIARYFDGMAGGTD